MSKEGSRRSGEVSAKSEEESKKVHPFIRAILKKEKSEEIAKEIIDAHHEDEKREIKPGEQDVGKEINKITENMIEVTDCLGTEVPENIRCVLFSKTPNWKFWKIILYTDSSSNCVDKDSKLFF